jgi:hypothetical protein
VHHVVEKVTSGAAGVEPPAVTLRTEVRLELGVGLPYDGLIADLGRFPDRTLGDELLRELERRVVDEALADPEGEPGVGRSPSEDTGLVDTLLVTGFCTETCFPASKEARTCSWCRWVGVRISTASISGWSSMRRRSV